METYIRKSDGKEFVEHKRLYAGSDVVIIEPIYENPMPLNPHTVEILRRLDKLDSQVELLMNDRLKKQRNC